MNCSVGRINLDGRFVALQDRIGDESLSNLNLNVGAREVGDFGGGPVRHAQDVCVVELKFGTGPVSGRNAVVGRDRSIYCYGDPLAIVTALRGNVPAHEADARNAGLILIRLIGLPIGLLVRLLIRFLAIRTVALVLLAVLAVTLVVLLIGRPWRRRSLVLRTRRHPRQQHEKYC
jgi:hypothetical protein